MTLGLLIGAGVIVAVMLAMIILGQDVEPRVLTLFRYLTWIVFAILLAVVLVTVLPLVLVRS